jgi:hypothetical protein
MAQTPANTTTITTAQIFRGLDSTNCLPTSATICTIYKLGNLAILESFAPPYLRQPPSVTTINCISNSIKITKLGYINTLLNDVLTGKGLVVSDGSYKEGHAAGGWIISSVDCFPQHRIEGSIISPGQSEDQDSHRTESSAMLGALMTIDDLLPATTTPLNLSIACDYQSVLNYNSHLIRYPELHADTQTLIHFPPSAQSNPSPSTIIGDTSRDIRTPRTPVTNFTCGHN